MEYIKENASIDEIETKVSAGTIARTIFLLLTMINAGLSMFGKNPLPFAADEAEIYKIVSYALSVIATLWAWWKNNSFTRPAILGDWFKDQIKESEEAE